MPEEEISVLVSKLFSATLRRYPNNKLDQAARHELLEDWVRLANAIGYQNFEEALGQARLKCRFMPEPAEINDAAEEIKAAKTKPEQWGKKNSHPADCTRCGGTRFVKVGKQRDRGGDYYERCG